MAPSEIELYRATEKSILADAPPLHHSMSRSFLIKNINNFKDLNKLSRLPT
jgi:hypothetical protein